MRDALQQLLLSLVNARLVLCLTMEAEFAAYMQLANHRRDKTAVAGIPCKLMDWGVAPVQPISDRGLRKTCCTLHIQSPSR